MADHQEFDLASATASVVIGVVLIVLLVKLLPALTSALHQMAAPLIVLWFIVMTLRSMLKMLLP